MQLLPRLALVAVALTPALLLAKTVILSPLEATTTIYEMNDRNFGGTLAVMPLADNKAAVNTQIAATNCVAGFAGIGELVGTTMTVHPASTDAEAAKCVVTLKFTSDWRKVSVDENGQCLYFHGASCGVAGVFTKQKSY